MVVCIADSSSTFRRRVRNALNSDEADYEYAEAGSGSVLMERLEKYPVDIVILTEDLDDMTGLEAVRAIRSRGDYAHTPVFLLSSSGTHEDVLDAVECGVTHYIVLPLQDEVLAEKISAAAEQVRNTATPRHGEGYTRFEII